MQDNSKGHELLARLDALVIELSEIRGDIVEFISGSETTPTEYEPSTDDSDRFTKAPSTGGLAVEDASSANDTEWAVDAMSSKASAELNISDDSAIMFVPKGGDQRIDEHFEPLIYFHPKRAFSLADTFLYANELCMGNRKALESILDEIEQFRSISQLENYLYQTLKLDRESMQVQNFEEQLKATASSSSN